jgi:hypothetical protein
MNINDKLSKVDESFTVYMYDNGFMFEVSGQDSNEDWATAKIMCTSMEEVAELAQEVAEMERT